MLSKFVKKNGTLLFELLIIIVCILAVFPAFLIAQYNVPGPSDDFFHGFNMLDKSFWEGVYYWYVGGYNGRFANAFFMQLPGRPFLSPTFGRVFPIVNFVLFFLSQTYLVRVVTKKMHLVTSIMISTVLFTFIIGYVPHITEFYWYSGMTVYVIPTIFYFLLLGVLLERFNKKQSFFSILVLIIAPFFIIGSNENWMLGALITIVAFAAYGKLKSERFNKFSYFLFGYFLILILMVILAPGTSRRLEGEGNVSQNQDLITSLTNAYFKFFIYINNWYLNSLLLIVSIVIGMILPKEKWSERLTLHIPTWLIAISILGVVYAGVFILMYSLGSSNIRLRGLLPVYFIGAILVGFVGVRIGNSDILQRIRAKISESGIRIILLILIVFSISNSTVYQDIVNELNDGSAKRLAAQNLFIINTIESNPSDTVYVPNVNQKSKIFLPIIISDKPKGYMHWITSFYFKKKVLIDDKKHSIEDLMKESDLKK